MSAQRIMELIDEHPLRWSNRECELLAEAATWGTLKADQLGAALWPFTNLLMVKMMSVWEEWPEQTLTTTVMVDLTDGPEEQDGWLHRDYVPADAGVISFDGLPGLAERCWADVWDEQLSDYRPCNAEATGKLGTCADHPISPT